MSLSYSPKQIDSYLESNARLNFWVGAVRSGKSYVCLKRFIHELAKGPEGAYAICGRTERTIKRNIIDPLFEMIGDKIHYRQGIGEVKLMGKKVYLVGASDQRAEGKIRGATLAGALVDEASLIPEPFFQMLLSRLSVANSKLFITTNPDSPFHWLKTKFIDRKDELDLKLFHFTLQDNPSLSPKFIEELKKEYQGLWYQRFIDGKWVLAEGAIYDFFDQNLHTVNTQMKQAKYYVVGVDYGTHNPTAFVLLGIDPNSSPMVWVEDEYYYDSTIELSQKTDYDFARDLGDFIQGKNVRNIYIDPAAASFKAELYRQNIPMLCDAENAVVDGIRFVSTMIITGDLKIGAHCKKIIQELGSYCWDEKSRILGVEKPKKVNDHLCDALRYAIFTHFKDMAPEGDMSPQDLRKLQRGYESSFYYTPPHAITW